MIPLHVDTPAPIRLTVKEEFVDYDVPEYTGSYNVTPSGSAQTLETNGKLMTDDVTVDAVSIDLQSKTVNPSTTAATVSPDAGYDGLSSVTVNAIPAGLLALPETAYSDRLGVAYIDVTVGVDDDGYVESSDGFTYPVKVNDIPSLPKQAAATITPTTSSQTAVTAKKWTTGAVTVDPIPSQYIVPTGTKAITANTSSVDVKTYEFASVNVPNSYAAGDEGKVVSNGALVAQTSDTVTTNATYDTTLINSLTVNVSGGPSRTLLSSGTYTKTDGSTVNGKVDIPISVSGTITDILVYAPTPISGSAQSYIWARYFDLPAEMNTAGVPRLAIGAYKTATGNAQWYLANPTLESNNTIIRCPQQGASYHVLNNTYNWYVWGVAT